MTGMSNRNENDLVNLKCSIQSALVEQVPENLVALTCGIRRKHITIIGFFRGEVKEGDLELVRTLGTEVIADFPEGYEITEIARSAEEGPLEILDFWAFKRSELV